MNVLFILGTRPEAIKLCAVIDRLRKNSTFRVIVCVTAQHRGMLDMVIAEFGIKPDYDLDLMSPGQSLFQSTSRIITGLEIVFERAKPDVVIVQGDTTTAFCGALAAFYKRVPVAHVEAGLRSGDLARPFPEEAYRQLVGRLASIHFAPTQSAADNLALEGVRNVMVTGNTGIDALMIIKRRNQDAIRTGVFALEYGHEKQILVTCHRRETFGEGFKNVCRALLILAARRDVHIVFPVHPNPSIRAMAKFWLADIERIHLIEPQPYGHFVTLMMGSRFILSDSGGIQEEAPSLGKPVLVLRDVTERPEAIAAGINSLVGTDMQRIVEESARLLDDQAYYESRANVQNPYGDGHASERIETALLSKPLYDC